VHCVIKSNLDRQFVYGGLNTTFVVLWFKCINMDKISLGAHLNGKKSISTTQIFNLV